MVFMNIHRSNQYFTFKLMRKLADNRLLEVARCAPRCTKIYKGNSAFNCFFKLHSGWDICYSHCIFSVCAFIIDGFVKSPISALRFISCSLRRTLVSLIPPNSRRLFIPRDLFVGTWTFYFAVLTLIFYDFIIIICSPIIINNHAMCNRTVYMNMTTLRCYDITSYNND